MCPRGTSTQNTALLRSPPAGSTSSACHGQKQTGGHNRLPPATCHLYHNPAGRLRVADAAAQGPGMAVADFGRANQGTCVGGSTASSKHHEKQHPIAKRHPSRESQPAGRRGTTFGWAGKPARRQFSLATSRCHAPRTTLTLEGAVICSRISRGRRVSERQAPGSAMRSPNMGPSPSKQSQEGGAVRCGLPWAEACALASASGEVGGIHPVTGICAQAPAQAPARPWRLGGHDGFYLN